MSLHFMTPILFLGSFTYDTSNYSCQECKTTSISVKSTYHHLWQPFFSWPIISLNITHFKTLTCGDTFSVKCICLWKDMCQWDAVNMRHLAQLLLIFNKMKVSSHSEYSFVPAFKITFVWHSENQGLKYMRLLFLWRGTQLSSNVYKYLERKYKFNLSACNLS